VDPELQAYFKKQAKEKEKPAYSLAFGHFFKIRKKDEK